ncbi:MAG: hypothetical protein MUP11_08165, partial [Anaerolineales bacterium]|nr:hypothetical protein [Anaerolineales bacterium]
MAIRFNLNVLPILRQMEKTVSALPGLFIANPPRRSPRRRMEEKLILHLHLEGNAPLSDTATGQLLTKLAEVYFETEGSTTSALRNVTDVLNKYLLDRNYRAASRGLKAVGFLTQVVLREDKVLYAQCGPSYIYQVTPDIVENLYDPDLSGSGLGLGKVFKVRYHQINLLPNQLIILTPKTPQTWTDNLFKNLPRMKLSAVVQRLLHKMDENLEAVLLFPVEGEGDLKIVKPNWDIGVGALEMPEIDQEPAAEPIAVSSAESFPDNAVSSIDVPADQELILAPPLQDEKINLPIPERAERQSAERVIRHDKKPGLASKVAAAIAPTINEIQDSKAWSMLRNAGTAVRDLVRKGWYILLGLIGKMLPDDQMLDLPSSTLSLIAILVPVVMVIFGSFFYINRGRNQLYDDHLSQAQTFLALAKTQDDASEYYKTVVQAMDEIMAARSYQQTEEVEEIYGTLREELDKLDRITRLDYQPLFSRGLGVDVTISKIVVTVWNDLYMLNA